MKEKENFEMVINLRRVKMGRRTRRFVRSIKVIREKVIRHFGAEKVIIDPLVLNYLSSNQKDKIKGRIRLNISKIGEKTYLVKLAVKVK
ncbi:MAG: 50S ribosomal protein L31e [Sulfolobaceae archaeon]